MSPLYPQRGILGLSSDGDDQRIFLDLKFSISGILGIFFCGTLVA